MSTAVALPLTPIYFDRETQLADETERAYISLKSRQAAAARVADEEPATPITVLKRSDLRALPSPEPIVDGLLYTNSIATLSAAGGLGKTVIALAIAASAQTGKSFLGRNVRLGKTLYIAGEGVGAFDDRIAAWELANGLDPGTVDFDTATVGALNPATLRELTKMHEREQYQLIVVDTIAALVHLKNENDNSEVSDFMRRFRGMCEAVPNTCGLLIHHVTETVNARGIKSTKHRGASAFRNDSDTVILGIGTSDDFLLTTEAHRGGKQRDGAPETISGLALRSSGPSIVVSLQTDDEQAGHIAEVERLVTLLIPGNGYTSSELQKRWGMETNASKFQKVRTEALDRGLIEKGAGHRGNYIRPLPAFAATAATLI